MSAQLVSAALRHAALRHKPAPQICQHTVELPLINTTLLQVAYHNLTIDAFFKGALFGTVRGAQLARAKVRYEQAATKRIAAMWDNCLLALHVGLKHGHTARTHLYTANSHAAWLKNTVTSFVRNDCSVPSLHVLTEEGPVPMPSQSAYDLVTTVCAPQNPEQECLLHAVLLELNQTPLGL